jgi:hypothetical protein
MKNLGQNIQGYLYGCDPERLNNGQCTKEKRKKTALRGIGHRPQKRR